MCFLHFIFGRHLENISFTARKKSLDMLVDLGNPMPKRLRNVFSQLCHRHLGSSSKMELVMEALYASTGSFAPTSNDFRWFLHGIVFLGKSDWLPFHFSSFWVCASVATYPINIPSNLCSRILTACASVATYSFFTEACKDVISPTPPHL